MTFELEPVSEDDVAFLLIARCADHPSKPERAAVACLDADERPAKEAGRVQGEAVEATWHWVDPDNDEPISVDLTCQLLNFDDSRPRRVALHSVQEVPMLYVGPLPEFVIHGDPEIKNVHAMHIAAWDPHWLASTQC